jgi:hypothetical protein
MRLLIVICGGILKWVLQFIGPKKSRKSLKKIIWPSVQRKGVWYWDYDYNLQFYGWVFVFIIMCTIYFITKS